MRSEQIYRLVYRLAIHGAPFGVANTDLDGHFIEYNDALCEIVGWDSTWMRRHT